MIFKKLTDKIKLKDLLYTLLIAGTVGLGWGLYTRVPKNKIAGLERAKIGNHAGLSYIVKLENGETYNFLRQNNQLVNSRDTMQKELGRLESETDEISRQLDNLNNYRIKEIKTKYNGIRSKLREE